MDSLPTQMADQVRTAALQGGPGRRAKRAIQRYTTQMQARELTDSAAPLRIAQLGSRSWVCVAEDGVSAAGARQRNLDLVVDALTTANVEYWVVDAADARQRITVAAHEHDRERALSALHEAYTDNAVYIGDIARPARFSKLARNPVAKDVGGVRVFSVYLSTAGQSYLGGSHACELEFWSTAPEDGSLVAPRPNRTGARIPLSDKLPAALSINEREYPTLEPFTAPRMFDVTFPIDVVYTWVDGNDPAWRARKSATMESHGLGRLNDEAANDSRFASRDELKYSLRSLEKYAPFVRKIFLVTDDQVPAWLDTSNERLRVVSHRELFGDTGRLPTFNSHAIESRLHRIPGLADHYLYVNDDVCFGRPVTAENFFHANGLSKFFLSKAQVDLGAPSPDDPPVLSAAKNNRLLIESLFGRTMRNKMKHTPHPQQRAVLEELEEKFPEVFSETASHQFRHSGDYSITSSLHHYYAYLTTRAVPGSIRYMYTDLSTPETPGRLRRLLHRRDMDTFCINDTNSAPEDYEKESEMLVRFFEEYFPERSSFER
ncbi:stealth conserved region 3 domain-containing protein [Streptomyces fuscigenes]|uniref:stealth conserved region 3 domain-containing protein n=1 Tax=Streptomyces fuscigenes TaxID=1528880 RepID=UPI001F319487|nr:stealth conserved region 3 domain-containing protein [Streptomyces fuscigenes]MCF3963614.1 stealth conserved region 3 domain-containing protein [Streptomyces fuscigenes]